MPGRRSLWPSCSRPSAAHSPGMCYSEFSTMIPIAGSAYTYSYATMGELLAWIIGWDLVLEYAVGAATVAVSWSGYVASFLADFGIVLPPHLINSPFQKIHSPTERWATAFINLPAVIVVVLISWLLITGIQESARANAVIVVLKVSVVILFIIFGWSYINPANHTPFIPPNTGECGQFGWSGIVRAAGVVFFAFIGFDAVSTAAQETKNPQRDMPIGIIGSLVVCTILYVLFSYTLTGIVNYTEMNNAAPVATAIDRTGIVWLQKAIKLGHHCRLHFGDSRDAARPVASVLLDVARRLAAEVVQRHPSQVPDSMAQQPPVHGVRWIVRGVRADSACR